MQKHKDWKNVFDNQTFAVFIPKKSVKAEYVYPTINDEYYNNSVFETSRVKTWDN